MPVKDLYYNKYIKYKNKYLNLQSQIGGVDPHPVDSPPSPRPLRQKSMFISDQGDYGTCFAHATTRLILKLITTFFNDPYLLGNRNCHYYYNTEICNIDNNIFDCFLQIKKGEKDCTSLSGKSQVEKWPEENFYALLFHFIFSTAIKQFGCNGAFPHVTSLYILDYLKRNDITEYEIKFILNYNEEKYVTDEIDYFNGLITKSVELFKDVKENLNNKIFNPIFYANYLYPVYVNSIEINEKPSLSSRIEYFNKPSWTSEYNLQEFTKTIVLKDNIKHILDHNYYALLTTNEHVVIITNCFGSKDDLTLEIKDSHGLDHQLDCTWVSGWCKLIKDNKIKLNELLEWTEKWAIIFFYPYEFINQKDIEKEFNENTSLKYLKKQISNDEGIAIARVLMQNTTLQSLYINECNIDDDVTKAIAGALRKNKTLTTLNLSNNDIGDDGVLTIATALEKNKTLNYIYLEDNKKISHKIKTEIRGKEPRIIFNSPLPLRQKSMFISDQDIYGTCFAHASTRLILKLITNFFNEPSLLGNHDCHYYYNTGICNMGNNIFDCFLHIKKGEKDCTSLPGKSQVEKWPEENFYALLFHFIFSTAVKQFGCNGEYPSVTCLYILDYLKHIDITEKLIKERLLYIDKIFYEDSEKLYFNGLITKLVELFKDVKENLNNKIFNPIFYTNPLHPAHVKSIKINENPSLSSRIEYFNNPSWTSEYNLLEFTKTISLQVIIKYVLDHNYYAMLTTNVHVVIITNCFGSQYDLTLEIKNSHGLNSHLDCTWVSGWCRLIKDNKIKLNELLEWTEKWDIIFFYPYEFINQKDIEKEFNENTSLKYLKKQISNNEGIAIARVLMQNTTLESLSINECKIDDDVTKAIAGALKKNKTLTTLNLSNNVIGNDGVLAIATALEKNKTLTYIYLKDNKKISHKIKKEIRGKEPRIIFN